MGDITPFILNVRGDLDTSNPITDRALGTLVTAKDVHPRYWGPRQGTKAFARIWESPGTAALYDGITFSGGASDGAYAQSFEDQFTMLGTKFTLDLWFRLEDSAYASGDDAIAVYEFYNADSVGFVNVVIYGPNHASALKILVSIATSATTTSADSTVTIVSSVAIPAGSAQTDKRHVRVVRDGKNATLYIDGISEGTTSSLSATHGIIGRASKMAVYQFGASAQVAAATARFKGRFYGALLRDGAFSSAPVETSMPVGPMARGVHHYLLGRRYNLGGAADHLFDAGPFGLHARVSGSPTYASSNDNTFPAPAHVQGLRTFTTRSGRTATVVAAGGALSFSAVP